MLAGGAAPPAGRDQPAVVEHALGVVGQRCRPVVVVAAPGQPVPELGHELGVEVLRDAVPGFGPLSQTGRGLRAARAAGAERAFVCAADTPLLSVDVIDALAGRAAEVDADVVLPWDGRDHYLAGVYRTDLAERIDALTAAGQRSMRALVDSVDTQRIVMSASSALNIPADPRALVPSRP